MEKLDSEFDKIIECLDNISALSWELTNITDYQHISIHLRKIRSKIKKIRMIFENRGE